MDVTHPVVPSNTKGSDNTNQNTQEIVLYIVGGATFEEALHVNQFNTTNPQFKVVLGGSCVHNSTSMLNEISRYFD